MNLQSRSQPEIFVAHGASKVLTGADDGLIWVDITNHIQLTSYDGKHTVELGETQEQIAQAVSWHQKLAIQSAGEIQLLDIERHTLEAKIAVRSEPNAGLSLDDEYLVWPNFDDGEICRYELRSKSQSCRNVGGHPISVVRRGERLFWNDVSKQGVFEAKFVGFETVAPGAQTPTAARR